MTCLVRRVHYPNSWGNGATRLIAGIQQFIPMDLQNDINHFKLAPTAAVVMGLGAAAAANADSGLITFTGSITDATCVVTGGPGTDGGQGNFIVALDPEPNTSFTAVGAVAGRHDFRVNVGPAAPGGTCGLEDGSTVASMSFGVGPNTKLSGRLDNILEGTAGSAEGFDLQIVDEAGTAIDLSTADAGLQQ